MNGEPTPAIELFSVCTACKMTADSFRSYTADERPAKANGTGALAIAEHLRGIADLLLRHVAVVAKNGDASGRVSNCEVAYADDMVTQGGFNRMLYLHLRSINGGQSIGSNVARLKLHV